MNPNLPPGLPLVTKLAWSDEFDGDLSKWRDNDLIISADHRTGNKYLQPDGSIDLTKPWHKLPGRWAALYDDYRTECQYIEDGHLVMKGHVVDADNPYRDNFTDSAGTVHSYGEHMLYTAWLSSVDTLTRGSVLEVRVDASEMCMRGHRWSVWLMPDDGKAYSASTYHAEIDCPELENPSRVKSAASFGNKALMKIVGGAAGDTPNGLADLSKHGLDMRDGFHTFTTVWAHDGSLDFYCDGIRINSDRREVGMVARVFLTREMNSGVKKSGANAWENYSLGPKMPEDPGLTGQSVILDVDRIDDCRVKVDYVRVWTIEGDAPDAKQPEPEKPIDRTEELQKQVDDLTAQVEQLTEHLNQARKAVKILQEL